MFFQSLLLIINFSCSFQLLIFDKLLDSCEYKSHKEKGNVSFANNLWKTSNKYYRIYFNFCDFIDEGLCGKNASVCIMDKTSGHIHMKGRNFRLDEHDNFLLDVIEPVQCRDDPTKKNKVSFKFLCSEAMKETPSLFETDICEYEVQMMDPNKCHPTCTTTIFNRLFDLRSLNGTFFVQSNNTNFSVALCKTNKFCGEEGISSCELSSGKIIPLSRAGNEVTLYNEQKMEVSIKGSYKINQDTKKLQILAKCNWDKTRPKLVYKHVQTQGKTYTFELESRHACIKIPPKCEVFDYGDGNIFYNLTSLYKNSGYWEVKNVTNSRILLNICGPLKLGATGNICDKSYSQVCEIDRGIFVNRGSIQTKYQIVQDGISTTFISGAICQHDPSKKYNTEIKFECSKDEYGPVHVGTQNCTTRIIWRTPTACPLIKQVSCNFVPYNCTFYFNGHTYDFNQLTRRANMYSIKDKDVNTIEYMLNVCGPVIDKEVSCRNNAMIAVKYHEEVNVKQKVKFLGIMRNISVVDDRIVLETAYGSYCEKHDYKSKIYFACSDKDESPILTKKTECYFEFLFKTKAACPNPLDIASKCLFKHPVENKLIDLRKLEKPAIKIKQSDVVYFYDICSGTRCTENEKCIYPTYKGHIFINNTMYLDFNLDRKCDSKNFNRTLIKLECNHIAKNDNYKIEEVTGCTLFMKLATNIACVKQELVLLERSVDNYIQRRNCSIILNTNTGYIFDIDTLKISIPTTSCPQIVFNYPNNSVQVTYSTNQLCNGGESAFYEYEIILKCDNSDNIRKTPHLQKSVCKTMYTLGGVEACKLLEKSIINSSSVRSSSVTGAIISVVAVLLVLIGLAILGFIKFSHCRRRSYDCIYIKSADL